MRKNIKFKTFLPFSDNVALSTPNICAIFRNLFLSLKQKKLLKNNMLFF